MVARARTRRRAMGLYQSSSELEIRTGRLRSGICLVSSSARGRGSSMPVVLAARVVRDSVSAVSFSNSRWGRSTVSE